MPHPPRLLTGLLLLLAIALAVAGCKLEVTEEDPGGSPEVPRIVVIAPSAAEMLDALGVADRVVGVGDFVNWPPSLVELPRVGGYDSPSVETVLELETDLLITSAGVAGSETFARLEKLGVEVLATDTSTFAGVFDTLRTLGERLELSDRAAEIEKGMRERLDQVRAKTADAKPRKVLFVVGTDPLYVAGPGSHLDELIRLAGGINIAEDALAPYQMVSLEAMIERMPEVIVDTSDNRPGAYRGRGAGTWSRWEFLPAVEDDRVYWLEPDRLVIPGPRLPDMAELVGRLIHPEIFGEPEDVHFGPLEAGEESPNEE